MSDLRENKRNGGIKQESDGGRFIKLTNYVTATLRL